MQSKNFLILSYFFSILLIAYMSGCVGSGVYSKYDKNLDKPAEGDNLTNLVQIYGAPDDSANVGDYTLVIWQGEYRAMSVWDKILTMLPLFAVANKSSVGVVIKNNKVLGVGTYSGRDQGLTVLGVNTSPVNLMVE